MGTNERHRRRTIRQLIGLVVAAVVVVLLFQGYSSWRAGQELVSLRFETAPGKLSPVFRLELADTDPERNKGLMYRKTLPADGGMFFTFPTEKIQGFWMRNTYIPLDMIFVDARLNVVGVLHDVPVLNEVPRSVDRPSTYVIELLAGTAARIGVDVGTLVRVEGAVPQGR